MNCILSKAIFQSLIKVGVLIALTPMFPDAISAQQFTNLHSFADAPGDGGGPDGGLVLVNNTLYGTTEGGGFYDQGAVFSVKTDGTGFAILHDFNGNDGSSPGGGLTIVGASLYGTTAYGGTFGNGSIFRIQTDGSGFTNIRHFSAASGFYATNSDGVVPKAGVIFDADCLYGTAAYERKLGN